jgi:hypothetical protein
MAPIHVAVAHCSLRADWPVPSSTSPEASQAYGELQYGRKDEARAIPGECVRGKDMTPTESALAVYLLGGPGLWGGLANAAEGDVPLTRFDLNVVDKQINPCSDFYEYSCSAWRAANPVPADQVAWSTGSNLQIWNETVLRETMEQLAQPDPKRSRQQQQLGDYWQACIDEVNLDRAGLSPIKADLDRISAMKSKAGLAMEIAHLRVTQLSIR